MVTLENNLVLKVLADATNVIAEGEVMQLLSCHDPEVTEKQYLNTIQHKTAKLFEAASGLGAIIAGNNKETISFLNAYGRHIGTAFQLIDDALDYESSSEALGKNIGDDLAEGKPTLPLLYAMWNGTKSQSSIIRETIISGGLQHLPEIKDAIKSTGAIQYTLQLAQSEASRALAALDTLPTSEFKAALEGLVYFAIDRES
jgi:octaprenyl-diphosphate synthase